ncbi:MAG: DNA methyltransferase [Prolixibacteraceae bacterium]|nr:DNA methyltransferase [Prolixibacteraceae bacterium]
MKKSNCTQVDSQFKTGKNIHQVKLEDVVISEVTNKLYDYTNHEAEIKALMESISEVGQKEPIIVIKEADKYVIIDGVLRLMAMKRLNLNEIAAIISPFEPTEQTSFADFIIHHHIRKEKTDGEKKNEIRTLLRIDEKTPNPLRDKEKRVALVSALMGGKGWARNNVFNIENILRWEKENGTGLSLSDRVLKNEVKPARAIEAINLIKSGEINEEMEQESCIIKDFLKGSYDKEKAKALAADYKAKKQVQPTVIDLRKPKAENFRIIRGNIETIELPEDLLVDTIFTSPPYYQLVKYGNDPNELGWEKTPDLYVKRLSDILMKCFARLKDSGSMFINIGETHQDFQCLGIIDRLTVELMSRGVRLVDKIIWEKPVAKPLRNNVRRLNPAYEVILHFSKTKNYYFDPIRTNVEKKMKVSKGCKERGVKCQSYHIPNQFGTLRNFINPDEAINIISLRIHQNRTKHIEGESKHPATFSMDLPLIPLAISCPKSENTVVMDPFMGSGSCGVTALKMGFKFVGVELYEENIATAKRILTEAQKEFDQNIDLDKAA